MSPAMEKVMVARWLPLVQDYEKVKAKKSVHLKRVNDLLLAYHVIKTFQGTLFQGTLLPCCLCSHVRLIQKATRQQRPWDFHSFVDDALQ